MDAGQLQTHACSHCQKVIFDIRFGHAKSVRLLRDVGDEPKTSELQPRAPSPPDAVQEDGEDMAKKGALFGITLGDLCAGVAAGCRLFRWLADDEWISRDAILSRARRDLPVDEPDNKLGWAFRDSSLWVHKWLPEPCPANTLDKLRAGGGLGGSDALDRYQLWASTYQGSGHLDDIEFIQFFGLWDAANLKIAYRTRHGLQAFTTRDDPAAGAVSNRPIERHPGSSMSLARVSSWLDDCRSRHPSCTPSEVTMPARLIEVAGTQEAIGLRLRQTEDVGRVPYAALSYCWGGEQPMKCLRSNVVSYGTAIPFQEQPPTIKDAARVCQSMGLAYLWIDALCIVQDDANDKLVEIAKMPSIYGGATVTIVAARSPSAAEGFLAERYPGLREGFAIPYRCKNGELGSITLVELGGNFESAEPIDERGWALQERLLSTRIVEFGSRQTRWICPETRSSSATNLADFTDGWRRDVNYSKERQTEALDREGIRAVKSALDFYGRPRKSQSQAYSGAIDHWEKICETFTKRKLALSPDRGLAISGIAQIFAELSGDHYLAGLWKSCFHSNLLWKIDHSQMDPRNLPRPAAYQGPSWSWLSVNGPVKFAQLSEPPECVAEILSCEAVPTIETAPYGLVREGSGRLVLAARTQPGVRHKVPLKSPGRFRDEVLLIGVDKSVICYASAELQLDVEGEEVDEVEASAGCMLVEITRRNYKDELSCQGLVLRWSSPERKTYSRVGRFTYHGARKGQLFTEYAQDGQPEEMDFDWFSDKPEVVEIV